MFGLLKILVVCDWLIVWKKGKKKEKKKSDKIKKGIELILLTRKNWSKEKKENEKRSKKRSKKKEEISNYMIYYHILWRSLKNKFLFEKKKKKRKSSVEKWEKNPRSRRSKEQTKQKWRVKEKKKLDKINKTECWKQTKQTWRKMRGRGSCDASISQQRSVKVLFLWFLFDSLMILFSFLFHWLICISCFKTRFFLHLCFL